MDYAITLYFDKTTEDYFSNIITAIAHSGVSNYMVDTKISPHITISFFSTEQIERIKNTLDDNLSVFTAGDINWASLGAFVPQVLFAAPILNEYLLKACITANRITKPFAGSGDSGHYLPYQWIPHTTLAVKLNHSGLKTAFDIASQQFTPFRGRSERLALVECNPYNEIKIWRLTRPNEV